MGHKNSKILDTISDLPKCKYLLLYENTTKQATVTPEEIQRIYKRFIKMDTDNSGSIDRCEFLSIPQISKNPLAARLFAVVDKDGDGSMDFNELLQSLSLFSTKGYKKEKLRC
ncbi:unnamed protein product [Pneumocystis jirovecii]|uniref:Calcineurin subunit B n=1 Tax=Pneumocystis jirovecii TaxID=42068 RepID=L0P9I9_PNEJI|nr:unnamed protein product [Pneumocystis jirovecii]